MQLKPEAKPPKQGGDNLVVDRAALMEGAA